MSRILQVLLIVTFTIFALNANAADLKILEPRNASVLKKGAQYYVRITCTARSKRSSAISDSLLLTYMKGLTKNGEYKSGNRSARTRVFHTLTLSKSPPIGTALEEAANFSVSNQTLHIPVFLGVRSLNNVLTKSYDGTSSCPDKMFLIGDNKLFLTGVYYHGNKTSDTPVLADIASFVATAWPNFRFAVLNNQSSTAQVKKFEQVAPMATAVTKLINGWRQGASITKPVRLREGTTTVQTSLTTVTITATRYDSFLRSRAPFRDNIDSFLPSGATDIDVSTKEKITETCFALDAALKASGLNSEVDRAYVVYQKIRSKTTNKEHYVRCLGAKRLAPFAVLSDVQRLYDRDDHWRITQKDIDDFTRYFPEEIPSSVIVDPLGDSKALAAQIEGVRKLVNLLVHRTRRSPSFDDLDEHIKNLFELHTSQKLDFIDETSEGIFSDLQPKAAAPFDVIKSLTNYNYQRFGCILQRGTSTSPAFQSADMFFVAFNQKYAPKEIRKDQPLQAETAILVLPRFDKDNKIAELVATDANLDIALALVKNCIPTPKSNEGA